MRYEIVGKDLILSIDEEEQKDFQAVLDENPDGFDSDNTMYDLLEPLVCNSEYEWVSPVDVAALTDAPILAVKDDEGEIVDAYAFMDYQVVSPQRELLEKRSCVFQHGERRYT